MFSQQDVREIAKQLKARGMDSLDLSLPVVIRAKEEPPLAKSLGELDVLAAYSTLVRPVIDSFDLAGLKKFRFRNYKAKNVVKAVTKGRLISLVDTKGREVFIANPNVFFPIIQNPWGMRSNLPTFHGFKNLPTEIRYKIWVLAAEPRRLVASEHLSFRWVGGSVGSRPGSALLVTVTRPSVPEVCAEARTALVDLGMYKVIRYQVRSQGPVKYFLLNPEMDILEITSEFPDLGLAPRFALGGPAMNPTFINDLSAITRLTLNMDHIRHSLNWVTRAMNGMQSLLRLKIWEDVDDAAIVYPSRLFLDFAPLGLTPNELLPRFGLANRFPLTGIDAITLIGQLMGDQVDDIEDRLFFVWNQISLAYTTSLYFPPLVTLSLGFWPEDGEFWGVPRVFTSGSIGGWNEGA